MFDKIFKYRLFIFLFAVVKNFWFRFITIVFLIFIFLFLFYLNISVEYHDGIVKKDYFIIPRGYTFSKIIKKLKDNNFIKNYFLAYYYGRLRLLFNNDIKSGKYELSTSFNTIEIINILFDGNIKPENIVFTVPEGYNIYDLAKLFRKYNLVKVENDFFRIAFDGDLIEKYKIDGNSLEGYLYPTTYYLAPGDKARKVVIRMLNAFFSRFPDSYFANKNISLSKYQVVTLASLIEKETAVDSERVIVSSVFYNRLALNMRMECDPTVIYALLRAGNYKGSLSRKRGDLSVLSPYNTYIYKGFPPSPIANPGKASIDAALNPSKTDYLFFVARDYKNHVFASSFDEHRKNVGRYRLWLESIRSSG